MFSTYRRHGIVIALALLAGVAGISIRPQGRAAVLPPITRLVAGTPWRIAAMYAPVGAQADAAFVYREWQVRDGHGAQAVLYLAATSAVQKMLHWTGELGYEGEGYQVLSRRTSSVRLGDGTAASISIVVIQRLGDREVLAYAVVSPDGIAARSSDDLWRTAWDTLRGGSGPYYLVRVSIAQPAGNESARATAERLLSPVLSALRADARTNAL